MGWGLALRLKVVRFSRRTTEDPKSVPMIHQRRKATGLLYHLLGREVLTEYFARYVASTLKRIRLFHGGWGGGEDRKQEPAVEGGVGEGNNWAQKASGVQTNRFKV